MRKKPDFSFASDMPRPKARTLAAFREWIRGPFRERMLNDPAFRSKEIYACGYRRRKNGVIEIIPQ